MMPLIMQRVLTVLIAEACLFVAVSAAALVKTRFKGGK